MKIGENHINGLAGSGAGAAERARQTDPLRSPQTGWRDSVWRPEEGDTVQLSQLSTHLRLGGEETPERLERVEQLRKLVQSGSYHPDPKEISRKIVEDVLGGPAGGAEKR